MRVPQKTIILDKKNVDLPSTPYCSRRSASSAVLRDSIDVLILSADGSRRRTIVVRRWYAIMLPMTLTELNNLRKCVDWHRDCREDWLLADIDMDIMGKRP